MQTHTGPMAPLLHTVNTSFMSSDHMGLQCSQYPMVLQADLCWTHALNCTHLCSFAWLLLNHCTCSRLVSFHYLLSLSCALVICLWNFLEHSSSPI